MGTSYVPPVMFLLLACAVPEVDTAGVVPDLPFSTCGGGPYGWLPLDQVGSIVDAEHVDEWSLSADAIRGLVGLAGVEDTGRVTSGAQVWRVRYRTQDRGFPAEATALFAVPDPAPAATPSLLYLHQTTGFEDFCAPSGGDLASVAIPIVLAGMGYAVAAPDYLGQNGFGAEAVARHPYLVAEPTAIASLDALRALWRFDDLGVTPSRRTVVLGASQGGAAAMWVDRYLPAYLPEAEMLGTVASVPPFDLVEAARLGASTLSIGSFGTPFQLYSADHWYGLDSDLSEVVRQAQIGRMDESMASECPEAAVPPDIEFVEEIYSDAWLAAVADGTFVDAEPWGCLLAESSIGRGGPGPSDAPLLLLFGETDDIAYGATLAAEVDDLCADGATIEAVLCAGLGHFDAVEYTLDRQLAWLADRMAGAPLANATCVPPVAIDCEEAAER